MKKSHIALGALASGLTLYALAGFVIIPAIAIRQFPALVNQLTGQSPQLSSIDFNPFSGKLQLQDLTLNDAAAQPLLEFATLEIDLEVIPSLWQGQLMINEVLLSAPKVHLLRDKEGRINVSTLIQKQTPDPNQAAANDPKKPLSFAIERVVLQAGQVSWQDQSSGHEFSETLTPIEFSITHLTSVPDQKAAFELRVGLASGGQLQWKGDFSVGDWQSNGEIALDKFNLKPWQPWFKNALPLQIVNGQTSLKAQYQFQFKDETPQLVIQNGSVSLDALELAASETTDSLVILPNLLVSGIAVDLAQKRVQIASLTSQRASIKAWREANGQLNYQTLFAQPAPTLPEPKSETPQPVSTAPPEPDWAIGLQNVALNDYQIQFTDNSAGKPVVLNFSELSGQIQGYSTANHQPLPIQLSARLNETGSFKLNANLKLAPLAVEAELEFKAIDLKTFQSYLDPWLALEVVDGDFTAKGRLQWQAADELQLSFNGDASISQWLTRDKLKNKDFVAWSNLDVNQIAIELPRQAYSFGKISLDKPYFRFTIKKDRTTNLDDILLESKTQELQPTRPKALKSNRSLSEAEAKDTAQPAGGSAKDLALAPPDTRESRSSDDNTQDAGSPTITIGKVEISDGRSDFADYSLILPFIAQMNALNGEMAGFSSSSDNAAQLKLKGKVYDMANVEIKGRHHFKSNDSAIDLNFKHMPLPLITPYMAEFAGYKIDKGQMALDLHYTIDHQRLQAQNKILIDQLVLGDKIENPKAVNLPLELAVTLLKDSSGKINLDFPISGSLEDPKFSVAALVGDVLINLVSKVATAPFKALSGMFDSDIDLSTINFVAGSSDLTPEASDKLSKIAQALKEKPELLLEIKALAYHVQDWPMLSRDVVLEVLKKKKSTELRDQKGERIRAEYIELLDADYLRLLAAFYAEVFPSEIEFSVLGKPRMKNNPDVDFYTIARLQLEAIMQPEPHRLNDLAIARSNRIAQYLSEQMGIDKERLYLLGTEIEKGETNGNIKAILGLNVAK